MYKYIIVCVLLFIFLLSNLPILFLKSLPSIYFYYLFLLLDLVLPEVMISPLSLLPTSYILLAFTIFSLSLVTPIPLHLYNLLNFIRASKPLC